MAEADQEANDIEDDAAEEEESEKETTTGAGLDSVDLGSVQEV